MSGSIIPDSLRNEILANADRLDFDPTSDASDKQRASAMDRFRKTAPPRYATARIENFRCIHPGQQAAIDQLRQLRGELSSHVQNGGGLVLAGSVGTGKDHLLWSMLYEAAARGLSVEWTSGVRLFSRIRDAIDIRGDEGRESRLRKDLCTPHVLAISDPLPPTGTNSAFQLQWLYDILDTRYGEMKSTWTTINVKSFDDAAALLSPPVADRLRDGALCIWCNWPSYRHAVKFSSKGSAV